MKYVCLCYADEEKFNEMGEQELDRLYAEQVACDETLRASGNVVESESLEPVEAATTVRVRNGRLSVTDGPFAETKEHLGGFFLIEARVSVPIRQGREHGIATGMGYPRLRQRPRLLMLEPVSTRLRRTPVEFCLTRSTTQ